MAHVIKNFFSSEKLFIQTALKNLPNKYFNFGQLLLSSVIKTGELLHKHAFFEPSQTLLGQSEPNLITIRFELLRFDCNRF